MSQAPREHTRLLFGSIELVPVEHLSPDLIGTFMKDIWHVPGGSIETTEELLRLAKLRDVQVSRLTINGSKRKLETLN